MTNEDKTELLKDLNNIKNALFLGVPISIWLIACFVIGMVHNKSINIFYGMAVETNTGKVMCFVLVIFLILCIVITFCTIMALRDYIKIKKELKKYGQDSTI